MRPFPAARPGADPPSPPGGGAAGGATGAGWFCTAAPHWHLQLLRGLCASFRSCPRAHRSHRGLEQLRPVARLSHLQCTPPTTRPARVWIRPRDLQRVRACCTLAAEVCPSVCSSAHGVCSIRTSTSRCVVDGVGTPRAAPRCTTIAIEVLNFADAPARQVLRCRGCCGGMRRASAWTLARSAASALRAWRSHPGALGGGSCTPSARATARHSSSTSSIRRRALCATSQPGPLRDGGQGVCGVVHDQLGPSVPRRLSLLRVQACCPARRAASAFQAAPQHHQLRHRARRGLAPRRVAAHHAAGQCLRNEHRAQAFGAVHAVLQRQHR